MGKIIAVCSGSGGTGKTTIALSLAASFAKAGKKAILLDLSGMARSSDLILGMESLITLDMVDVITAQIPIDAALYPVRQYDGLRLACASLYDGISVSELAPMILTLHSMCDFLVVDMPTGQAALGKGVLCPADERLIVLRADNASIRSSERLIAGVHDGQARTSLALNRVEREYVKSGVQYSAEVVAMLLDQPILAEIPEDASIAKAAAKGRAAVECTGLARAQLQKLAQAFLSGAATGE